MVPTFLGSTVLVFTILQLAPGGPLEQTILQLQMGGMAGSGEGGVTSTDMVGGSALPASALKDLKRFYGFDKPIYQRYLIWLGLWPREIKHRDFTISSGQSQVEKRVGKKDGQIWRVDVKDNQDGSLMVYEKSGHQSDIWVATVEESKEDGTREAVIFQHEFSGILTGNLGRSYTYMKPVTEVMRPRFKISLLYGLTGIFLSYLVCIPLGIRKALNHGSVFDFGSSVIIFIAYSIPGWALGGVLLVLFGGGSFWDVFPLGGFRSPVEIWETLTWYEKIIDQVHHMILPIIAWSIASFATMTVLMKNSLLENLSQDYIRTAFAKGLREKRVVWVHAMRNSVIPIASGIGHIIGVVIAGSYFIERVFNIDGFGKMAFEAVLQRDYPITLGFLVIVVLIRLIGNIISDLALATVDPRIRFK
jgi:microcin C transport system permease protein|tara:strand:+ start:114 stop:1367 length:1254 start_codon:yes stop_codon:yes gene_type:complete